MERFERLDAVAAPIAATNVNTDQIIPARFLRKPRSGGLAPYLFHDLRFDDQGRERPDFVLNRPQYREAKIIVANRNFACGSSREYAVLALLHFGIRAVIAPSFGDIFFNNCFENGMLPVVMNEAACGALRTTLEAKPGVHVIVDLGAELVTDPDQMTHAFTVDPFRKHCLREGINELDFTLGYREKIATFEARQDARPWLR